MGSQKDEVVGRLFISTIQVIRFVLTALEKKFNLVQCIYHVACLHNFIYTHKYSKFHRMLYTLFSIYEILEFMYTISSIFQILLEMNNPSGVQIFFSFADPPAHSIELLILAACCVVWSSVIEAIALYGHRRTDIACE